MDLEVVAEADLELRNATLVTILNTAVVRIICEQPKDPMVKAVK